MGKTLKRQVFWALFLALAALQAPSRAVWGADVGYDKGFYLLSDDKNYKFKFNIQLQPRHEYANKEAAVDTNTFRFARLRTYFSGFAISPKFKYLLTVDYNGLIQDKDNEEKGQSVAVRDALVDLGITDAFNIQVGQFYVVINREGVVSGIGNQLVSWSLMATHFEVGRDLGVQIYGNIVKPLQYYVFVFNGDGISRANRNKEVVVGTRLESTILGKLSPYEGDIDNSENPNLGVGATILYDFGSARETEEFEIFSKEGLNIREDRLVRGNIDGNFTWRGFSLLGQWQYVYNTQYRTFDHGFMGQSGYFIIPKKLEIAARYSAVFPDFPFPALSLTGITKSTVDKNFGGSGVPVYEMTAGVNYFFKSHLFKIQMEYSNILNRGGIRNLNDQIIRTQLTLVF